MQGAPSISPPLVNRHWCTLGPQLRACVQACELYSLPEKEPLGTEGRGPAFSSFSSGFLSGSAPRAPRTGLET